MKSEAVAESWEGGGEKSARGRERLHFHFDVPAQSLSQVWVRSQQMASAFLLNSKLWREPVEQTFLSFSQDVYLHA